MSCSPDISIRTLSATHASCTRLYIQRERDIIKLCSAETHGIINVSTYYYLTFLQSGSKCLGLIQHFPLCVSFLFEFHFKVMHFVLYISICSISSVKQSNTCKIKTNIKKVHTTINFGTVFSPVCLSKPVFILISWQLYSYNARIWTETRKL